MENDPSFHEPEAIADDLDAMLAELRQIRKEYPYGPGLNGLRRVRRKIAARLQESGLHQEADHYAVKGIAESYGNPGPPGDQIGRFVTDLTELIRSLREDPKSWRTQIAQGVGQVARRQQARTGDYVNKDRIAALEALPASKAWNPKRLIQLCKELNLAQQNGAVISIGSLVRAIMDHTAPLFGHKDFKVAASNAHGSYKDSMMYLASSKQISHQALHAQIGPNVSIPTPQQVDVKNHLDVLIEQATLILQKDSQ